MGQIEGRGLQLKGTGFSPYIKRTKMNLGFTCCGKTHRKRQEVSGHDFSRAEKANKTTWALAPEGTVLQTDPLPSYVRTPSSRRALPAEAQMSFNLTPKVGLKPHSISLYS